MPQCRWAQDKANNQAHACCHSSNSQQQVKQEELLPESSEVLVDTPKEYAASVVKCKEGRREWRAYPPPAVPTRNRKPVARGLAPSYAASARRVLMCSTRGLLRLQDTLTSNLSSVYVNSKFEDGQPCRVSGCPLNPNTRVRPEIPAGQLWWDTERLVQRLL